MLPITSDGPVAVESFIGDHEWAVGPAIEVHDPGRLHDLVGTAGPVAPSHVREIIATAQRAQPAWARMPAESRATLLARAADDLEAHTESFAVLMTRENGSPLATSRGEVGLAVAALRNAAQLGVETLTGDEYHDDATSSVTIARRPYGVVACIVPWNAPLVLTAQKIGPALICGNAVVVKPSPFAPLAVTILLRHIAGYFPPGTIGVIHGDGDVGTALISDPGVRKISFTGGIATASSIMASAAPTLTPVHFELGGNDPAILLDDADLSAAVDGILPSAFRRSGQVCFAVKRVYVPEETANRFSELLLDRLGTMGVGHGLETGVAMGPVSTADQFAKLKALRQSLLDEGAVLRVSGRRLDPDTWGDGYYLQPSVVLDADPEHPIVREEQFGPILPIVPYSSEAAALRMANGTDYGLTSSVWSSDPERAFRVARKIEAGMTFVNGHGNTPLSHRHAPFGGIKRSGIGWENSRHGLQEFLEFHSIVVHDGTVVR